MAFMSNFQHNSCYGDIFCGSDMKSPFFTANLGVPTRDNTSAKQQHAWKPVTTGTSVLGVIFDGGVAIAADMLVSYGSLARFRNCSRLLQVNKNIILGGDGDYADYQHVTELVKRKIKEEEILDDGIYLKPKSLHCWVTRILYGHRSKMQPLWSTFVIGGLQDGEPFLGAVDIRGTAYVDKHIATGFGSYLAVPILREEIQSQPAMNKAQALELLKRCMGTLYFRDARSSNKYEIATITADGSEILGPLEVEANWEVAHYIKES